MNINKKYAFSLMEAMIILLLISIAIMALVPLMSKQTTSLSWKAVEDNNGNQYLTYGNQSNQHVGFGTTDSNILNNAKTVATDAAIGYNSNADDMGISLGRDHTNNNSYTTIRPFVSTAGRITIGQHACTTGAINISSYDTNRDNNSCLNTNIVQIGDATTTSIQAENGPIVTLKAGNQNVIVLNNNDFDFNLPDATHLFGYTHNNTTLTFYQNINITGNVTFTTWMPNTDPDPGEMPKYVCLSSDNGQPFIRHSDATSRCNWFCTNDNAPHGANNPQCNVAPSDKRLKDIKSTYTKSIDELKKLETYTYTYKNDKNKRIHAGLIAQKIIGIFDEALHKDDKGFYSYEREPILYTMVNSVKDIYKKQNIISKEQYKSNKNADKLLRRYSK